MSFGLLWVELLAVSLCFAGTLTAWGLRREGKWARRLVCGLGAVMPALVITGLVIIMMFFVFYWHLQAGRLWWAASLLVAYVAGEAVIRVRGGRADSAGVRRALSWSPGRLAMGLVMMGLILIMTVWNLDLQAQVEVQALRARAGAIALAATSVSVPESLDAAPLYGQLEALHKEARTPEDEKADYASMAPSSPELAAYLRRQEKTLAMARRAADLPGYNVAPFGAEMPDVIERELSHLGTFRLASSLLTTAARREAASGEVELALADCRRAYGVGNHVGSRSLLISGLVQVAIEVQANRAVAEVLPYVTSRGQLDGLRFQDPAALRRGYVRCLRTEEAFGLANFYDFVTGEGTVRSARIKLGTVSWWLWLKEDSEIYRRHLETYQEMAGEPYFKMAAARAALDDKARSGKPRGILSGIIVPSLDKVSSQFAEVEGMCLAAGEARALTLYRLEHGSYPEDAAALVPTFLASVPIDPIDGKPLRYVKRPDGSVVIYSVGRDGKDDGGAIEKKDGRTPADMGILLRMVAGK